MLSSPRPIEREFSIYLDFVRILAAGLVLIEHTNLRVLSDTVPAGAGYGHSAVVVFFVLSGCVISHVTTTRERAARSYAISRLSRLYSVMLPALLLCAVLDTAGRGISPETYVGQSPHDWWWVRVLATLTFMNEPWGVSITAFSAPFWSVAYEGWYYILFGIFTFWRGAGRWPALAVAAVVCGPKVLLLMPIWLAGVYLHRGAVWPKLGPRTGMALVVATWIGVMLFHAWHGPQFLREVVARLVGFDFQWHYMTWSGDFLGDYVIGVMVTLNFAGFRAASSHLAWLVNPLATVIRWAASFTFSLYLYHRTFILFYIALIEGDVRSYWFYFSVLGLTLLSVYALGLVTEHRKEWFRNRTEQLFGFFEKAGRSVVPHRV